MMFLFAIPCFEGLAIYLLPKILGTRDLAFPRLTAYGYWCYVFGGVMLLVAMLLGIAPDAGWFIYPPLSGAIHSPGINTDFWLIGITFVEISAIAAAVEITVSVLKYRAPGMALDKMPIFAWYALITALMILTGFPPLILGSVLLELERAFGLPFFQAELGGDSLLWQHLFWLFGHPEVYIIFLPAAGVISTVLPVMCRTTLLGYGWIVAAAVALAFLSFGLWVHHMFTTGIPHMGLAFFSAASTLVAVPTAVQIFAWIGTMWKGRPELHLPMLHILGFFCTFVIGGLTGVMVAVVPFDWQAHDTAFITAHLHYVLFGGFVFPILAGVYYWLPHVTGQRRVFRLGEVAFALVFLGFHVTFLAMHWVGLMGQRRRIPTYAPEDGWTVINLISSVGSFVLAIGLAMILIDVVLHVLIAARGKRNPWRAGTLEWAMMTPPPAYTFASLPQVDSRTPLADDPHLAVRLARGEGYLATPREGARENALRGHRQRATGHACRLSGQYPPAGHHVGAYRGFLPVAACEILLDRAAGAGRCRYPGVQMGLGERPQGRPRASAGARGDHAGECRHGPALAGMVGHAVPAQCRCHLFGALLFGFAFLWTVAPGWPPPEWFAGAMVMAGIGGFGALIGPAAMRQAIRANRRGDTALPGIGLALVGALAVAAACAAVMVQTPAPMGHAYGATLLVLGGYGLFHAGLGALMAGFLAARVLRGFTSRVRQAEFSIVSLWIDYLSVIGLLVLLAAYLPGLLS